MQVKPVSAKQLKEWIDDGHVVVIISYGTEVRVDGFKRFLISPTTRAIIRNYLKKGQ
jgi:chemotaxis protein CheY-P-specific phosphatase CheC